MRVERLAAGEQKGSAGALVGRFRALVPAAGDVERDVAAILADVRARGDAALEEYTRRFDTRGADPLALRVEPEALERALDGLDGEVRSALELARDNVRQVAEAALGTDREVELGQGQRIVLREVPVESAAVYVPAGRHPYPSTVVMGAVTALAAGVPRLAVCSPPGAAGEIPAGVLAACALTGAGTVYRMGGAHAIAALAHGTQTVEPVDVIVGPGSLHVQEAKRQLAGLVGSDGFAGPSDLVVIAAGDADPRLVALDLLAQGEHGPGTLVLALSDDDTLLDAIADQLADAAAEPSEAVCVLAATGSLERALELAERFAPEHLELTGAAAEQLAPRVARAGCLFVGATGATAFGDYVAGSNHVLPTAGAARFSSALSPATFRRRFNEVHIGPAAGALARAAAPLARAEGFELHAESMEARIRENGSR